MTVRQHVLGGGIASLLLSPIIGLGAIPFWIGSVLIDVDHYLEFIYNNGRTDFSLKKAHYYHYALGERRFRPEFLNLSMFHTVEFSLLFYLGAWWLGSPMLKAVLWGMIFHVLFDGVGLLRLGLARKRAHSWIEFLIRKEIMKRKGLDPFTVCGEALDIVLRDNPKRLQPCSEQGEPNETVVTRNQSD